MVGYGIPEQRIGSPNNETTASGVGLLFDTPQVLHANDYLELNQSGGISKVNLTVARDVFYVRDVG